MNPAYKWFKTSGIISPEKWGNLPGGECFTSPGEVNGTFVVDGVVGDWLCARYGLLQLAADHRDRSQPHRELFQCQLPARKRLLGLHPHR